METSILCSNIWSIIVDASPLITAIATIVLTCYIHRLTSKSSKKENYFRHLIELYYKIEDDSTILAMNNIETDTMHNKNPERQAKRRIRVNCNLMIYYLQRIPGYYKKRWEFIRVLESTSSNPDNIENYEAIADYFKNFCWILKDKKNTRHSFSFKYDGGPIEQ